MKTKFLMSFAVMAACAASVFADGSVRACSTIVYRGQLNLRSTQEPATYERSYEKTMHFRVYDGDSVVWRAEGRKVTVNKDGSFVVALGDDDLAALIATGRVSHVGVAIGPNVGQAIELVPRRELRPVAAVNRALVAEGASPDPRVGNLATENALVAGDVTISRLEVAGAVTAPGAGTVNVSPVVVGTSLTGVPETLTLLRGGGMKVFAGTAAVTNIADAVKVKRGDKIGGPVPSDGFALISSSKAGERGLRIPGVIQYCRKGEYVRAPATEPDGVNVKFFPFVGAERSNP